MKRFSAMVMMVLVLAMLATAAAASYSGRIAGTNLSFSNLTFNRSLVYVRIRNPGLAVRFSAMVELVDRGEVIARSSGRLERVIPASGQVSLTNAFPIIRREPTRGVVPQVRWVDVIVTPVQN